MPRRASPAAARTRHRWSARALRVLLASGALAVASDRPALGVLTRAVPLRQHAHVSGRASSQRAPAARRASGEPKIAAVSMGGLASDAARLSLSIDLPEASGDSGAGAIPANLTAVLLAYDPAGQPIEGTEQRVELDSDVVPATSRRAWNWTADPVLVCSRPHARAWTCSRRQHPLRGGNCPRSVAVLNAAAAAVLQLSHASHGCSFSEQRRHLSRASPSHQSS